MKRVKTISRDKRGACLWHEGIKYRPEIASAFADESSVLFVLPHPSTNDSHATVRQGDVTETWNPQV